MSNPVGRPTGYKDEYADSVVKLCLLGATDAEIGDFYGVSEQTINTWKKKHPEFFESIKTGKEKADANVAQSLYQTAIGGNTTAQIFWLKNRRKDHWRDKQEIDHTTNGKDITGITRTVVDAAGD